MSKLNRKMNFIQTSRFETHVTVIIRVKMEIKVENDNENGETNLKSLWQ